MVEKYVGLTLVVEATSTLCVAPPGIGVGS